MLTAYWTSGGADLAMEREWIRSPPETVKDDSSSALPSVEADAKRLGRPARSALSVQLDTLRVHVVLPLANPSSCAPCGARLTSVPVGFHQTNGRRRYFTFA